MLSEVKNKTISFPKSEYTFYFKELIRIPIF